MLAPAMTGEQRSIGKSEAPVTVAGLAGDLRALGVREGSVLLVHSSVSALGWVCGGAQAVALALLEALGPDGTLVVPTHTNGNSDPAEWGNPPVPEAWWPVIRAEMPAFDPAVTPSLLGAVTDVVRTWPGARRSAHPHYSCAAVGPAAEEITAGHELTSGLGERSPLARVHDRDGDVLLLGVGHRSNTSMHLAEHRVAHPRHARNGAAVATAAGREWVTWDDVLPDEGDFEAIGEAFDATGAVRAGRTGVAGSRLMRQRALVAFAVRWMDAHRAPPGP
jgi:aminoglycoside 3-N-acetyltransferase